MNSRPSCVGALLLSLLLLPMSACDRSKSIGESCPTNCATGADVRCMEENPDNGCSSKLCVSYGTEYTAECLPCYESGSETYFSAARCLEGVVIRIRSQAEGRCTRMCASDEDCADLEGAVCRACSLGDARIAFTEEICRTIEYQRPRVAGICAPPRDEQQAETPLVPSLDLDPQHSCYVPRGTSESLQEYLSALRQQHPDEYCHGYCTKPCYEVTDCPNQASWDCIAPYTVGGHPLVGQKVCVQVE